jgi:hypothetical protein
MHNGGMGRPITLIQGRIALVCEKSRGSTLPCRHDKKIVKRCWQDDGFLHCGDPNAKVAHTFPLGAWPSA